MSVFSYFYIIRHVKSGLYYAGCRYAKGCNPSELLVEGGYITSSSLVKRIITIDGIDSFVINRIRTFDTRLGAFEYERKFLKRVKASSNMQFLNASENSPFIDNVHLANMLRLKTCNLLYGVDNVLQNNSIKTKQKETILERYGVSNISMLDSIKDRKIKTRLENNDGVYLTKEQVNKTKSTCLSKYGVDHPSKSDEVRDRTENTCIEKYGVSSYLATEDARNRLKETSLERYGVDNPSKSKEVLDKINKSLMNSLGVEWAMQSDYVKQKSKDTCIAKYGVEHYSKTDDFKQKVKKSNLDKYGVDHLSKTDLYKQSKLTRDSMKRNRPIVINIKKLAAFLKLTIGKGWDLKTDDKLLVVFEDLLFKFNSIGMISK